MPLTHLLLLLLVVLIWGINFIFLKISLDQLTPFMLCAARFILASIPAIFFIKKPATPFRWVILYGLVMFALQFTLLFMGMHFGVSPGLTSLILQVQVFFSMLYAAIWWDEVPSLWQIIGALIAFAGIGLVAMQHDNNVTIAGFLCILSAAAVWGLGNVIAKKIGRVNMMALVVWGSFVACIPMTVLSLLFDGIDTIIVHYHHITWQGIGSVLFVVYGATWIGYTTWSWLLSRYPVATIAPFTLLVPIIGMLSSVLVLGESFQAWKLWACVLVISGLSVNLLGAKYFTR